MDTDTLETAVLHLPPEERAALAHKLLLSLEVQSDSDVEQAWHAEAQRRADQILHGQSETVSAQEAAAAARSLLR